MNYRWSYPSDWAEERVTELVAGGDVTGLAIMIREVLAKLDEDTIQDLWQREMEEAGYFEPVPAR